MCDKLLFFHLGSVQISYHAPRGGGVQPMCDKSVRQGGIRPMCDKNVITLNIRDFILKITKNA